LIPKEHGAYGQLLFPLVTALAIGDVTRGAVACAAAAAAVFLAHEPLLVILGQRGGRAARERRGAAWRWLLIWTAVAVLFGGPALVWIPRAARLALLLPITGGAALVLFIARRRERTGAGELVTAVTLSSLAVPVGIASGGSVRSAVTCAVVFAAAFVAATTGVRALIASAHRPGRATPRLTAATLAMAATGVLGLLAQLRVIAPAAPWAAFPVCAVALGLMILLPSPARLRVVGSVVLAAMALTSVILVSALR
jgi:hypothetical protein